MLFEEFQDGCLVHGHIGYINRMILAILSPFCLMHSIKFLFETIYGLKDAVLKNIKMLLISDI